MAEKQHERRFFWFFIRRNPDGEHPTSGDFRWRLTLISKRTAVYAMTGWSQEKVENGTTEAKPNGYEFTTGIVHRF